MIRRRLVSTLATSSLLAGFTLLGLVFLPRAYGEVRLHPLFTDHAVLQSGMEVPVWGWAAPQEDVTVEFQGQKVSTTADSAGNWRIVLKELLPGGPFKMTVAGQNRIEVQDILVGEVWIASGQSNMQWPLQKTANAEEAIAQANHPTLRLFTVPRQPQDEPQPTVDGAWQVCSPETVRDFSAVAYYFGIDLQKALKSPVGLIHTSFGGTPAEAWSSPTVFAKGSPLESILQRETQRPQDAPVSLYNGMIAPLQPVAFRGVIWYQGESNAGRAVEYITLFPAMIQSWREAWQREFPFLFVQLAPFMPKKPKPSESAWAELREAQRQTLKLPKTGMAVITDVGDENDIHPQKKQPVGARLALLALREAYGKPILADGPIHESVEFRNGEAVIRFGSIGGGLVTTDGGPVTGLRSPGKIECFTTPRRGSKEIASTFGAIRFKSQWRCVMVGPIFPSSTWRIGKASSPAPSGPTPFPSPPADNRLGVVDSG